MESLLAAFLLGAAWGAEHIPTKDWPFSPEESIELDRKHTEACARVSARFDRVEELRLAYKKASDPDEALLAWERELKAAVPDYEEVERLKNAHKAGTHAVQAYLVARSVNHATTGGRMSDAVSPGLQAIMARNEALQTLYGKQLYRRDDELSYFLNAAAERARTRDQDAQDRTVLAASVAVVALLLVAAAWTARRYSRAEDLVPLPAVLKAQTVPPVIGGNIDVVRPIGRGGMGEVYEGLDRTLQRRVALKRLRSELTGSPNDLSRLLAEARLVAALKHDNIVAIHSVEKEAGQVFLVFEYVDGPTLSAHISQFRQLAWPEALRIFSGACAALGAAHAKDIVHRDLKPGNIMLDSKGVVKVMDFGLAHQAAQAVSRLTRSGAWGTPPYMSPEQELGEVNKGVDLFALNVCLYEMLTGELPFTGPNFLAQKREKVYVPVTKAVPALPKALDAFFAAAFDPDPAKRFPDALTLAAAANAIA